VANCIAEHSACRRLDPLAPLDRLASRRYHRPTAKRAEFVSFRPKTILNRGKRADHCFWSRYSAYPYKGCMHGCEFCYCREKHYCPFDDPDDFGYIIKVKENAPELLRRALSRLPVDLVMTGDYQAAERKFGLSRKMLEAGLELGFPVSVLERSPSCCATSTC